jgi:hypothetical protein
MLRQATFWEEEGEAPLLQRNNGYLSQGDAEEALRRVQRWPELAGAKALPEDFEWPEAKAISEENQRIVLRDAERTFLGEAQRQKLQRVLTALIHQFGDYHQGLGYTTSFLMLTLDEAAAVSILSEINTNERYLPGYWKHEAVGFATDALVFEEILAREQDEVVQHLKQRFILPETYCQKWFVGLGVHVLPFELLFAFFEGFLAGGSRYLFQFGLSVVEHLRDELLRTKDAANLYALLRLDPKHRAITPELLRSIVARTPDFAAAVQAADLPALRREVYDTKLRPRLEAARRSFEEAARQKKEEDGSDSEGEGSDDGSDDGEGEECQLCKEMSPELYCHDCKLLLCGACHEGGEGDHSPSHRVEEDWEEANKLAELMSKAHISSP